MPPRSVRAAAAGGAGRITLGSRPLPEPGPGELRLRVLACGICGTDLHFHQLGLYAPGLTPGHEIAGEVDRLGDGVPGPEPGSRVAVEPLSCCGRCESCRVGRSAICPEVRVFGLHRDGGLADYLVVPAERVFAVPPDLPPPTAALAEPLAVAVHALRRGDFAPGKRVLVLGAGSIGMLSLLAARSLGAESVWISARHPQQAELAKALGAERVLGESEAGREGLEAIGREQPVDLVIETVGGSAATLSSAGWALRPGGTVSVLGVFFGAVEIDPLPLLIREGSLVWSNCYDRSHARCDFEEAVALLDAHREIATRLTTHALPLAEIGRAFELAGDKRAGVVKVSVVP